MKLLAVLVILMFFLVGCGTEETNVVKYNFKQGYNGLNLNFIDNAPPDRI